MKTATLLTLLSTASAATIRIDAGKDGKIVFSPDSVTANKGDVLEYHFYGPIPHSVAVGDFSTPCNPAKEGGFFSGMVRTNGTGENDNVFRVTVDSTDPIFFYCTVPGHCPGGMSGVINPKEGDETLAKYKDASKAATVVPPPAAFGGKLEPATSGGDETTSTTSTKPPGASNTGAGNNNNGGGSGGVALGASVAGVLGGLFGVAALLI